MKKKGGFETYRDGDWRERLKGENIAEREREGLNNQRGREKERRLVTCAEIVSHD